MIIISPVIYFELGSKVLKGIKQMRGIESLVILPVAAFWVCKGGLLYAVSHVSPDISGKGSVYPDEW